MAMPLKASRLLLSWAAVGSLLLCRWPPSRRSASLVGALYGGGPMLRRRARNEVGVSSGPRFPVGVPSAVSGGDDAAAPAPWTAEAEFGARLAVVEALRGVDVEDGDVISRGYVTGVSAEPTLIRVDLDLPGGFEYAAAEALAERCEAAAEATRDALAAEGAIAAATPVDVVAAVGGREQSSSSSSSDSGSPAVAAPTTAVPDGSSPAVQQPAADPSLGGVRKIVAVSSCKGGVGKSTVAANLAFALRQQGLRVGICDADVYGPSLPTLVGAPDDAAVRLAPAEGPGGVELLAPFTKQGVKLMSFGFLNAADPAMMRGSRVSGVVEQLARRVAWGDLDVLVIDLPPGTGDVQLTVCQSLSIDAAVVVTTPSRLAFEDVVKGVKLFDAVDVPVVAVVENMARVAAWSRAEATARADAFLAEFGDGASRTETDDAASRELAALLAAPRRVFGAGHARQIKEMWGIEAIHELDLWADVARRNDEGTPVALVKDDELSDDERAAVTAFGALADDVLARLRDLEAYGKPPDVAFDGSDVVVSSSHAGDERTALKLAPIDLRLKCRCAECVTRTEAAIRADYDDRPPLTPVSIARSGNYAVEVLWSDGHVSLLPFKSFVPVAWYDASSRRRPSQRQDPPAPPVAAAPSVGAS